MTKLLVYFETEPEGLGHILGSIGSNMIHVENLRVETQNKQERVVHTRTRNNPPKKDTYERMWYRSQVQLMILRYLKECVGHTAAIHSVAKIVHQAGFAKKTPHAAMSAMVASGLIIKNDRLVKMVNPEMELPDHVIQRGEMWEGNK